MPTDNTQNQSNSNSSFTRAQMPNFGAARNNPFSQQLKANAKPDIVESANYNLTNYNNNSDNNLQNQGYSESQYSGAQGHNNVSKETGDNSDAASGCCGCGCLIMLLPLLGGC